jgi:hypothetical protein
MAKCKKIKTSSPNCLLPQSEKIFNKTFELAVEASQRLVPSVITLYYCYNEE